MSGLAVCELAHTASTEKSEVRKACVRLRKEKLSKVSWAKAAGGATAMSRASPTRAPQAGNTICKSATVSARIKAKWPSSMIIGRRSGSAPCLSRGAIGGPLSSASEGSGPLGARASRQAVERSAQASFFSTLLGLGSAALPVALLFQRLGDLGRHVGLIVLSKHRVGQEPPGLVEDTFGDHALAFAEKIRQDPGIAHIDRPGVVGDGKLDGAPGPALEAAGRNQSTEANALTGPDAFGGDFARRVEEDDRVTQGEQHQQDRETQNRYPDADKECAPLFAGHEPSPKLAASALSSLSARSSPAKWRRASASAARASLLRSKTT